MPEAKLRYYLHSKVASTGHRPIFLLVGVGEARLVRQATGHTAQPAYFAAKAPHLLKGTDGYRSINEELDELRLTVGKACRRLEDQGQLSNATLAPLLKAAAASLVGRAAKSAKTPAALPTPLRALPHAQQPMRAVLAAWQADNGAHLAKAYLDRSKQYVDWMEHFDPAATPPPSMSSGPSAIPPFWCATRPCSTIPFISISTCCATWRPTRACPLSTLKMATPTRPRSATSPGKKCGSCTPGSPRPPSPR